jgi:hypothetical protein
MTVSNDNPLEIMNILENNSFNVFDTALTQQDPQENSGSLQSQNIPVFTKAAHYVKNCFSSPPEIDEFPLPPQPRPVYTEGSIVESPESSSLDLAKASKTVIIHTREISSGDNTVAPTPLRSHTDGSGYFIFSEVSNTGVPNTGSTNGYAPQHPLNFLKAKLNIFSHLHLDTFSDSSSKREEYIHALNSYLDLSASLSGYNLVELKENDTSSKK